MAPSIDINRLRRMVSERDALGGAYRELGHRLRELARDIPTLERDLMIAEAASTKDDRGLKRAQDALAAVLEAKAGLESQREDISGKMSLSIRLATNGIAYAKSVGLCPADLGEEN